MAYSKQNFQDGQILNAANLEAMENGIIAGQGAKNLLVNSDFRNPIDIDNKIGATNVNPCFTRWNFERANPNTTTQIIKIDNGIRVYKNGGQARFYQSCNYNLLGKTVSYAVGTTEGIFVGSCSVSTNSTDTQIGTHTGYLSIYQDSASEKAIFSLFFNDNTEDAIDLYWAALYEGAYTKDTLPDYIPKDRSTELFDCGISSQPYNLIINGNFRKNAFIASDGLNTNGYLGNKWKGHVSITAVQNDSNIKLTASAQYSYIYQRIDVEVGKAYTFVVKTPTISSAARVSIYNSDLSEIFSNQEASSSDKIIITTAIPTSSPISCLFYPGFTADGGYSTIEYAALYEGAYNQSTLPTYTPYPKQIEMMRCGMAVQPENLLNNSDFTNVINSKGLSSYEGQVEGIDGWTGRVIAQKVEVESTDVKIRATGTAYAAIRQKIVKIPKLVRKTITFAAKLYSNVDADIRIADAGENMLAYSINPAGQTNILIVNYTVPSGATADTVVPTIMLRTQASGNYMKLYWAALYEGVYDASTLPPYIPKGRHVEMLNCGVPLTPHNLLDNSDFRNPVNQRGKTSYSGICYTIDRWRSWGESMQINVSNGGIIVSGGALYQCVLCDPSKTYTAAVCLSDGTIICSSGAPIENSIGDYDTLWVYESDGNLMFRIGFDGTEHKYVWAALYEGAYTADTLPAYQPKGYAAELAECQRYYYAVDNELFLSAWADKNGCLDYTVLLPQTMRAIPTVTFDKLQYVDESGYVSFTNSPYYTGRDRVAIRKLGLTPNKSYGLAMKFSASADL